MILIIEFIFCYLNTAVLECPRFKVFECEELCLILVLSSLCGIHCCVYNLWRWSDYFAKLTTWRDLL